MIKFSKNAVAGLSFFVVLFLMVVGGNECRAEVPVYRLFNDALKTHLYTTAETEKAYLESVGWQNEGVAWNAYVTQEVGTLPVYRFYSAKTNAHHYTMDEHEKSLMTESAKWRYEGIAWYAYPSQNESTVPIYRFYSIFFRQHLFTADANETQALGYDFFWNDEGIAWYAAIGDIDDTVQTPKPAISFEIKDSSVSVGGIVQTTDKQSGIVVSGQKDPSGQLTQIDDITLIHDTENSTDIVDVNIDYANQEVKMATPENFAVIDNYDPIEKTVTIKEGTIKPDGTTHQTSTIEKVPVGDNFKMIVTPTLTPMPNPEDWIPVLKSKGKGIFQIAEKFASSPLIKYTFNYIEKDINVEISQKDQIVIDKFSSLADLKDNLSGWRDCFNKKLWSRIGCSPQLTVDLFEALNGLFDNPDDITISGQVTDSEDSQPVSGIKINIPLIEGSESTSSGTDGSYSLSIPEEQLPSSFAVIASGEGYVPVSKNVSKNDSNQYTVDFVLEEIPPDMVILEIEPTVHHIGDGNFSGAINSQFQAGVEGTSYTTTFEVNNFHLSFSRAEISLFARGLENSNPLSINSSFVGNLSYSPGDGSFATMIRSFDADLLTVGSNTLEINSAQNSDDGDYDDFEFTNIIIQFKN